MEWNTGTNTYPAARRRISIVALPVLLAVVLSLLTWTDIHSQEPKQGVIKEKPKKGKLPDPTVVFRGIERAWNKGDASEMIRYVGSGRVYLDIYGANNKGGYFSRSQVYFLFKRHFSATRQVKFSFLRLSKPRVRGNKAFGTARRIFRDVRSGRVINDKVYVTLRREGKKWVLSEIKSMR